MTDQPGWAAPGSEPPNDGSQQPPQQWAPQQWGPPQMPPAAAKPGVIPLRPLGLGEILDGAISYIRANPIATLGLSAAVITATQLIDVPVRAFTNGQVRDAVAGEVARRGDARRGVGAGVEAP
jgi:hypothetical protein